MREWLVIEKSWKNAVFAPDGAKVPSGYIPRDAAEKLLGRDLGRTTFFSKEDSEKLRAHPEWSDTEPPGVDGGWDERDERINRMWPGGKSDMPEEQTPYVAPDDEVERRIIKCLHPGRVDCRMWRCQKANKCIPEGWPHSQDTVDKATAWDEISRKNAEIVRLRTAGERMARAIEAGAEGGAMTQAELAECVEAAKTWRKALAGKLTP